MFAKTGACGHQVEHFDDLGPEAAGEATSDELPEGDDYFSIRGELIYTRPESGELVIKVRQQPRPDGSRPVPFKLQLRGDIPLEHLRHFVSLDVRRQGQALLGYEDGGDFDGDAYGRLGAQVKFNQTWGVVADVKIADGDTQYFVGPRITW